MEVSIFSERLAESMLLREYDVKMLSVALGISTRAMRSLLRGKRLPRARLITKIAKTLSVSSDYLIGLSDDPPHGAGTQ